MDTGDLFFITDFYFNSIMDRIYTLNHVDPLTFVETSFMNQHMVNFPCANSCPMRTWNQWPFCNCVQCSTYIILIKCINCIVQTLCVLKDFFVCLFYQLKKKVCKRIPIWLWIYVSLSGSLNLCYIYVMKLCYWVHTDLTLWHITGRLTLLWLGISNQCFLP